VPVKILLADDHDIVRQGLKALLERDPAYTVVAEARNGLETVRLTLEHQPDVVVADLSMPEQNGLDSTAELRAKGFLGPIIILSSHDDHRMVAKARAAGATGFVAKEHAFAQLQQAIAACMRGATAFFPSGAGHTPLQTDAVIEIARLTPREREVLTALAQGISAKEIAFRLGLSPKTIAAHRQNLTARLAVDNLADLTRLALRAGLIKD